jgi:large subunit ribosomal protein L29
MEMEKLRAMSAVELAAEEKTLRKELFNLRFQKVVGHMESPSRIKQLRREIAQILTCVSVLKS